jgi:FlaA1/EpsC-like NDP-sugar epimerase
VNISTDKAADPTSVLGATKRLAEVIVAALSVDGTQAASVRFGNVLGSRGSFLHSLAAQVACGKEITVTHPDVTRYFMTIPEAAGLVIEAAVMAEAGETYVLDMGTPVRIVDLVSRFLTITGASSPGITFSGLRPGEKMHEALFDAVEIGQHTRHPRIASVCQDPEAPGALLARLAHLQTALADMQPTQLRSLLLGMIPVDDTRCAETASFVASNDLLAA